MDRASIADLDDTQDADRAGDTPSAIAHALREITEAGGGDTEHTLDLACERLAQSIAVAERLRVELRAHRAEQRLLANRTQVASEMLTEGVLIFDRHGRVVYANNAAGRILSMSHDQLLARHVRDRRWRFLHEDGSAVVAGDAPGGGDAADGTHPAGRRHGPAEVRTARWAGSR